jgi:hypothetical protein
MMLGGGSVLRGSLDFANPLRALVTADLAQFIWTSGNATPSTTSPIQSSMALARLVTRAFPNATKLADDAYIVDADALIVNLVRGRLIAHMSEEPIAASFDVAPQPPGVTRMNRRYQKSVVLRTRSPAPYFEQSDYNVFVWSQKASVQCEVEHTLLLSVGSPRDSFVEATSAQLEAYRTVINDLIAISLRETQELLEKPMQLELQKTNEKNNEGE